MNNKFKEWFKKNIFEAYYNDSQECYRMVLFGISIDFRNWFVFVDDNQPYPVWYLESDIRSFNEDIEKKNKRRKNKIPLWEVKKIPWYVSIVNWRSLYYRSRMLIGFIVGFILGAIIL